jgi:hypothetical protein
MLMPMPMLSRFLRFVLPAAILAGLTTRKKAPEYYE